MGRKGRKLNKFLSRLTRLLPTPMPIKLTLVNPDVIRGYWGFCIKYDDHFEIQLAIADYGLMYYTLLHEYAHALVWDEKDFHGEAWGIAYSKIWRVHANELI